MHEPATSPGPIGVSGRATDIIRRRTMEVSPRDAEERLRQAQRLDAIGRLSIGVAHDFNNHLTVILGFSAQVMADLDESDPRWRALEQVQRAGERAAGLARQLLAFSSRQALEPRVLYLNTLVQDLERMLWRLLGEDIDLTTKLEPALGRVMADPGRIEQVILNLVVNARDAMPRGGCVELETANVEVEGAGRPGPHVCISVTDTGTGMSPETLARLFEPFFTTKAPGRGTGLGLSMVHGIVRECGGHVTVESEVGRGTTFRVFLPRVAAAPRPAVERARGASPGGSERILLVEDDDAVRALARETLTRAGYAVVEADSGPAALAIGRQHEGEDWLDLLLTDVVLPRPSGRDLAEALRGARAEAQPPLKVLFMSGYADDAVAARGVTDRTTHYLEKPFTPDALLRQVRAALDG